MNFIQTNNMVLWLGFIISRTVTEASKTECEEQSGNHGVLQQDQHSFVLKESCRTGRTGLYCTTCPNITEGSHFTLLLVVICTMVFHLRAI